MDGRLALTNHVQPGEWSFVAIVLALLLGVTTALFLSGKPQGRGFFGRTLGRFADSLERETGLPAWAAAGLALGEWALLTAMLGFFWDVSWHIDLGRDRDLFSPPHVLIVLGLWGIFTSAVASVALATYQRARTGWRFRGIVVPYSSMPLLFLGGGAMIGFPLDDLWHTVYGVDVTMWSPTHLTMIGGAVFSTFAYALMLTEGGRGRRPTRWGRYFPRVMIGAIISALTAFELEFDLGVPQWQQLYHPVLIAAAAGIGFCAVRVALGRWGTIRALAGYLLMRGLLALWIGPLMGHDMPHFPIYIGAAVAVEAAWYLGRGRSALVRALVAGALVATLGLGTEWAWTQFFGLQPWNAALLPGIWAAVVMALAAAVLGTAVGGVLRGRTAALHPAAIAIAGVLVVAMLLVPFPRHTIPLKAHLTTSVVPGTAHAVIDNSDRPSIVQEANIAVTLTPADAADGADWFRVSAWQGGGFRDTTLRQVSPGHYVAESPMPVGGSWKTMIRLARHDIMVALPVSMPDDPSIHAPAVPLAASRDAVFVPEQQVLMRETHNGPAWPATLAIAVELFFLVAWMLTLTLGYRALSRTAGPASPSARATAEDRRRRLTPAGAQA